MSFQSELMLLIKRSVPFVAIPTLDAPATEADLIALIQQRKNEGITTFGFAWDVIQGASSLSPSPECKTWFNGFLGSEEIDPMVFTGSAGTTAWLDFILNKVLNRENLRSIFVFRNAHRYVEDAGVAQGICSLRSALSTSGSMLVFLGPLFTFPSELRNDIYTIDYALPDEATLGARTVAIHKAARLPEPNDERKTQAVKALRGLSAFAAEQALALALTKDGLDSEALWRRKYQMIEGNPGLKIHRGKETFSDIGGCDNAKSFFSKAVKDEGCIVFVDEIEKALSGTNDTSGVSQDALGQLLSYMSDNEATGSLFIGPPGAAKSALAKAIGNEVGLPTLCLDIGGLKASLVGESEKNMRQALRVITAISGGKSLWVATCNRIAILPPELRRRFSLGTFFFDLPSEEERVIIWQLYLSRYPLDATQIGDFPDSTDWTGDEIRRCCMVAYRLGCTLREAADYIVPVAVAGKAQLAKLREEADGCFLSASTRGFYRKPVAPSPQQTERKLDLDVPMAVISPNFSFMPAMPGSDAPQDKRKIGF